MKCAIRGLLFSFVIIVALAGCGGGGGDEQPPTNAAPTTEGLATVKAFVSDLRTWGTVINTAEHKAFQLQTSLATDTFNLFGARLRIALEHAFRAARDAYIDGGIDTDLANYFSAPVTATGEIIVSGNMVTVNGIIAVMFNGVMKDQKVSLEVVMPTLPLIGTAFTIEVLDATLSNETTYLKINSGTATIAYDEAMDLTPWVENTTNEPFPEPVAVNLNVDASISEIYNEAQLITDPVIFGGTFELALLIMRNADGTIYRDMYGEVDYNPSMLTLNGGFSKVSMAGERIMASLTATMSNADSFRPAPVIGDSRQESETNFREIIFDLDFTETLPSLPEANFSLKANRDGFKSGDLDLSITYGEKSIIARARIDNDNVEGNITLTNDEGVVLVLNPDFDVDVKGATITYGGAIYGTVDKVSNGAVLIHYYDGSFESF